MALRDSPDRGDEADKARLVDEIRALSAFIDAARVDLASLRPRDIQERFIPTASDELDAIVQATEVATDEIMDAVEGLEVLAEGLSGDQAKTLNFATTRIYEACTFQDITGQRITKVVKTLKSIEERVDALLDTFGGGGLDGDTDTGQALSRKGGGSDSDSHGWTLAATGDRVGDEALLNGPGMAGEAMNQDDIDALLNDFD
ncbi:MAG: chemotaxis protein CheZ [Rhodospirillum sp.]|nr:chemotaxis protein CheZ [Rhodospirillum sp.]MCF8490676.1 chemotaxis protein CheZ [Rhodospirillum sp.]MCF8502992.1 chemotaxis protein CheZ [Rhodospirillum sp.]